MNYPEDIEVCRFFRGVPESLKPCTIDVANSTIRPHALYEIVDALQKVEKIGWIHEV